MHNGTRIDVGASGGQWNGEWRTLADDCVTGFGLSVCIGGLALSLGLVAFTFLNCKRQHQHRRRFFNHYYNFYYDFFAAFFANDSPFARSIGYYLRFRHYLFIHLFFVLPAKLARPHMRPLLLPFFNGIY